MSKQTTTLSRRDEFALRLASAFVSTTFRDENGKIVGMKSSCLFAIEVADIMLTELDKK